LFLWVRIYVVNILIRESVLRAISASSNDTFLTCFEAILNNVVEFFKILLYIREVFRKVLEENHENADIGYWDTFLSDMLEYAGVISYQRLEFILRIRKKSFQKFSLNGFLKFESLCRNFLGGLDSNFLKGRKLLSTVIVKLVCKIPFFE